jgi:hypothetical protein
MIKLIIFIKLIFCFRFSFAQNSDSLKTPIKNNFELLTIFYYDYNDGFGYSKKELFLNFVEKNESFDVLLVHSTKGFQKYDLVVSVPDFELLQGTIYPLAFNLEIEFKKWTSYKFFL